MHVSEQPASSDPQPPPRPGWVKVLVGITVLIIAVVVVAMLLSGGEHGPARHLPGDGAGDHTPPVEHSP